MTKRMRQDRARRGGNARALSLSPRQRRAIAKKAATTRWAQRAQEAE